jgi:putative FmdB family regulatory protein
MPTYSYVCDACGGSFEIEQRISEDPLKVCTLCGKSQARRQIVSGNFILKGGGWYSDGYGSSGGSKAKSTASAKSESSSSASSSGDSSTGSSSTSTSTSSDAAKAPAKAAAT